MFCSKTDDVTNRLSTKINQKMKNVSGNIGVMLNTTKTPLFVTYNTKTWSEIYTVFIKLYITCFPDCACAWCNDVIKILRQPSPGRFGFKRNINYRCSKREMCISNFVSPKEKLLRYQICDSAFVNISKPRQGCWNVLLENSSLSVLKKSRSYKKFLIKKKRKKNRNGKKQTY